MVAAAAAANVVEAWLKGIVMVFSRETCTFLVVSGSGIYGGQCCDSVLTSGRRKQ